MGNKSAHVGNKINIRNLALDVLLMIEHKEGKSHELIKDTLDKYDFLSVSDKGFFKRLVHGTVEYRIQEDYIIGCFSKTPTEKIKPVILQILRMSIYQYLYMDRVPDSAVCDEAVKLTVKRGLAGLKGYVNGVLRSVMRGYEDIRWPDKDEDIIRWLEVKYSCPGQIVKKLCDDYGTDRTESILDNSLKIRSIYVRIDESLGEEEIDRIYDELREQGCISDDDDHILNDKKQEDFDLEYALKISEPDKLTGLSCFKDGFVTIQDIASMSVCEMAFNELLKERDICTAKDFLIFDLCACPGGKSLHAAAKLKRYNVKGHIIAGDISDKKLDMTAENIRRLKCQDIITLRKHDATEYDAKMSEKADLVIADVPCSGLGVMGRKPDIKYNISMENMEDIVVLQRKIIDNALRYVRPGGMLVYSTCTMNKNENDDNATYILKTDEYVLLTSKQFFIEDGHDGFYTAVFKKKDRCD